MEPKPIRHRVEYTRNKHSRAICRGETIVIRLARNLSKTEEQEHISSLLRRMTHLVLQERQKVSVDPFRPLLNGVQSLTVTLATGKKYVFTLHPGSRTRALRTVRGWKVSVSPQLRKRALHRFLWSLVAETELPRLTALVHAVNAETYRAHVKEVRMKFASTQWGSCSQRGVIMLNTALLFLPPSLLKYVIVHELAHRIVPNHSDTYWRQVAWAMPGYEKPYKALQGYRLPQL
jgi:predicted metal-dependent hydrolase